MWFGILKIVAFLCLASFGYAAWSAAPWVPMWGRDIERLKKLLALKPGERVYELGCGDGRVCVALAKDGVQVVGVELSFVTFLVASVRRAWTHSTAVIRWGNLFKVDLRDVDAVYFFLMPKTMERVRAKLEAELAPGTRVVSYVWPIPGWTPEVVDRLQNTPDLYLYRR